MKSIDIFEIKTHRSQVWEARENFIRSYGPAVDFELPSRTEEPMYNPFDN